MEFNRNLQNPFLRLGLSSKLSLQASKGDLLLQKTSLLKQSSHRPVASEVAKSSQTPLSSNYLSKESKGPSLFNKNLAADGILNNSSCLAKTNVSIKGKATVLPQKDKKSLKGSLHSSNLSQLGGLNADTAKLSLLSYKNLSKLGGLSSDPSKVTTLTEKSPITSNDGKIGKLTSESVNREKRLKGKKVKSKGDRSTYDSSVQLTSEEPTYEISLASTLMNDKYGPSQSVNNKEFFQVKKDDFVEKKDDRLLVIKEKEMIDGQKMDLINLVSIVLLQQPDFDDANDEVRKKLMRKVSEMASIDPEFILKLALYTRKHLNLRVVTNFILAYCAYLHETRPFLKKYFGKCIGLPTDWVKVAELYQTFFDKSIEARSLPTALRNAMVAKFPDFDEYQLGKYNKEKPKPAKVIFPPRDDGDDDDEEFESRQLESYTLKKLVRKLHISEPVYHVMSIVGKKYPEDSQSFYLSRLPGTFDETKAGQRMKLPIPETWETQVSLKGNNAETWQDLIDRKKLPFMAMLRNLRNMLIAGISQKHHNNILKRLTDQKQVINSQQFPFRFLSPYEILDELGEMLRDSVYSRAPVPSKRRGGKPITISSNAFSENLLRRYKNALDKALTISVIHNIPPICGTTLILIYYDPDNDNKACASTKSLSKQRTVVEMCLLIGLMCKFHCEDGILILLDTKNDRFIEVEDISPDAILDNMDTLKSKLVDIDKGQRDILSYLNGYLTERKRIDVLLKLGGGMNHTFTNSFMNAYRKDVNPTCLGVTISLLGNKSDTELIGKYDVHVCGFSDQILMYVAERGNGKQLSRVEKIDIAYGLEEIKVKTKARQLITQSAETVGRPLSCWRVVRVFISSTFRDMHGERDLLTRYVFPELRAWAYNYCLNIYEVDLRWGITEKQSDSQAMELCLREVNHADLFVGLLGQRYGWVPDNYDVKDPTGLEWLEHLNHGYSITELEMRCFKEKVGSEFSSRSMFYFRDPSFTSKVPKEVVKDFTSESAVKEEKLERLKTWLQRNGAEIYRNYPCQWGGIVGNKPMVSGLEDFGQRVLRNLWHAIEVNYLSSKSKNLDDVDTESSVDKHAEFAKETSKKFVGRKRLVDKTMEHLTEARNRIGKNLLLISGRSGSGKTAFMCKLMTMYSEQMKVRCCSYFLDASEGKQSLIGLVRYICEELNISFNGGFNIPEKYSELKIKLEELFNFISKNLSGEQCMIFIDSLDKVEAGVQSSVTDWIPEIIPKGIHLVISCTENTTCQKNLSSHKQIIDVVKIGPMEHGDRADFVRQFMANYGKALDESAFNNQMKLLLSKKDSSLPLYLQLACDELRMFGVYEDIAVHIKKLSPTISQLIELSLQRMEVENGEHLIRDTLSLIYSSRQGLNKDELFDALNMLHNFKNVGIETVTNVGSNCFRVANYIQQQIPMMYFIKICLAIKIFLNEDMESGVLKLIHYEVSKVVEKRYILPGGNHYLSKVHIVLAGLHKKQADPANNLTWNGNDRKALMELPYHLVASGIGWKDLQSLLCSLNFIKAKVKGDMCSQLLEDFHIDVSPHSRQLGTERNKVLNHPDVLRTKEFVSENIHILSKYPSLLMQQAVNSPAGSFIQRSTESFTEEELQNVVVWLNKSHSFSTCSLTITQKQALHCVCLSKDETMIACGMADGQLILYDKSTTKELKSFIGHTSSITSCCFLGTNKLCSASEDGSISIWDIYGGQRLHLLAKHTRSVSCCISTDDGKLMLSTSLDNTAKLWNTHDGSIAGELPSSFIHPFNCVALDPQEKHAALGSWNQNIIIWNILENNKVFDYKGHKSAVRALAYAPSGRYLASASLSGEIYLWSTTSKTMVGQLQTSSYPMNGLCYTPSSSQLVGASSNKSVKIWAGSLGVPGNVYLPENIKDSRDYALCVAAAKGLIAVGYNSGKVIIFDLKKNVLNEWKAHKSSIRAISFMTQENRGKKGATKHLITASDDSSLKRWSITSKVVCLYTMTGHTGPIKCMRSNAAYIISGSEDCTMLVWPGMLFEKDSEDEIKPVCIFRGHTGTVTCCDLSPCETMSLSGSTDKSIILWDMNRKTKLCMVNHAHSDGITACSWSDVGNYVVTGSNDFLLKLWDAKFLIANAKQTDKHVEKFKFVGHGATINDVKYKYGTIVSACTDGSVKVWSHKGTELTTFSPHEQRINGCDIWADSLEKSCESNWSDVIRERSIQQSVKATKRAGMDDVIIYTASDDGIVSAYKPFKPFLINELYGHTDAVSDVLVNKKSLEVISCSLDKTIKIWEPKLSSTDDNLACHSGEVSCLAIQIDGRLTASGGYDGYIHIYEDKSKGSTHTFKVSSHAVKGIGFLHTGHLVTGDNLGRLGVWDIEEEKLIDSALLLSSVQSIAVGGVSYIAASSYQQFQIYKWDGISLALMIESLKPTSDQLNKFQVGEKCRYIFEYPMSSMVFVNGSNTLLSSDNFYQFHNTDVEKLASKKGVRIIPKVEYASNAKSKQTELDSASTCISYIQNDSNFIVLIGNANGTISFNPMNYITGKLKETFSSKKFHEDCITGILYNDTKEMLVTASKDCTVKLWRYAPSSPVESIQQIGLYHCRAPVTKLVGSFDRSSILMVGDANGNVDFLKVNV